MGIVLSRFRKEKSTSAVLEGLQEQIQQLEEYVINTQERKRRFVSNFLGFTIGIYIVGFALWYFFYFPPTVRERLMYLVPLLIFPLLIVCLRSVFQWYFQRKLNKNGKKLTELKEQKGKILEQVMDKETYKVAVNLLERFGDRKHRLAVAPRSSNTALNRTLNQSVSATPKPSTTPQQQRSLTPYSGVYRNVNNNLNSSVALAPTNANTNVNAVQELRRRTPFPVVDERGRSAMDRIMDFIVGDSPQDRYGMICKKCHAHNGMLPREEYEYTTFRCAFCETMNPARKSRPVAPRLALEAGAAAPNTPLRGGQRIANESSDSGSNSSADEDEEDEDARQLTRSAQLKALQPTDATAAAVTTTTTTTAASHETETGVKQEEEKPAATAAETEAAEEASAVAAQ